MAAGLGERQVAVTSAANRKTFASTNHLQNQNCGYFDRMTTTSPNARALAALGHDARLSIFRLLVKAGEEGLRVGDIGEHLGLAPSTLAHHLSTLVDAGLVLQDKQGARCSTGSISQRCGACSAF